MDNLEPLAPEYEAVLHAQLQDVMQREVYLMRELLSNMHQEEVSLMLNDKGSLLDILQQRSLLIEKISALRLNQQNTLLQIKDTNPYFSTPLEISSLGDQLNSLTEKIHRQTNTNQRLTTYPEYYHHLTEQVRPKKKITVTTLQIKR